MEKLERNHQTKAIIEEWMEYKSFPMIEKLPNSVCVDKTEKKSSYRGAKEMKGKTGVTLMVCTSADGWETKAAATYGLERSICKKNMVYFSACGPHMSTDSLAVHLISLPFSHIFSFHYHEFSSILPIG